MIEALIAQALKNSSIGSRLAQYAGAPAVFYAKAPHDKDPNWAAIQYPRVDYDVLWRSDPERTAAGVLMVSVWCLNNQPTLPPEEIGEIVIDQLKDLFLTDERGETYALEWVRSDSFDDVSAVEPVTIGETVQFDILPFPLQRTTDPDPIEGAQLWLKHLLPDSRVIGIDTLEKATRATDNSPILYARMQGDSSEARSSYAVTWMDAAIQVHVFAPNLHTRQNVCRTILNQLAMDGEIVLTDRSPMFVQKTALALSANPLQQGQISISARYGILRHQAPAQKLNHPNLHYEVNINGK